MSEVKPCPFCGSSKVRVQRRSGRVGTACPSKFYRERVVCECGASSPEGKAPGKAVAQWNLRKAAQHEGLYRTPYYCTDCEQHIREVDKNGRCGCGSGRVVSAPDLHVITSEVRP